MANCTQIKICLERKLCRPLMVKHMTKRLRSNFLIPGRIGHLRVQLCQNESKCETFHMKMSSACSFMHANQSNFHKNRFALRLALKQRNKGTRKWPIQIVYFKTVSPARDDNCKLSPPKSWQSFKGVPFWSIISRSRFEVWGERLQTKLN